MMNNAERQDDEHRKSLASAITKLVQIGANANSQPSDRQD
jgi:hypothetical protein